MDETSAPAPAPGRGARKVTLLAALAGLTVLALTQWTVLRERGFWMDATTPNFLQVVRTSSAEEPTTTPAKTTSGATVALTSCRETSAINVLNKDPCYAPSKRQDIRQCNCRSEMDGANAVTYALPPTSQALNKETIANHLLVAFIHINKAGGSTIKKDVIFPTLASQHWDGAGLGTFQGWPALGEPWAVPTGAGALAQTQSHHNDEGNPRSWDEPVYIRCGKPQHELQMDSLEEANRASGCPLRAVWGSMALGLCDHFPKRPCIYLVILRDPLERAISNYNYVCIQGAENRKKWRPEWRKQGFCPLNIWEFFEEGLGEPHFLLWRLTRGCDTGCGAEAAIHNLGHPCMRFLLLEDLADGIARLEQELGPAYVDALREVREKHRIANAAVYDERIETQLKDEAIMADLRKRLQDDIRIYQAAKSMYASQWTQPLASCNAFSSSL